MHIPDGYLSPSTCAALYAGAAPFWWVALRRVRARLHGRTVPLLSLVSAFCFVAMMFNLPLPGGTSGHAVGMGIAAVVLGPWAAILAVSVALAIQALFFGDGGVTAYGANCFNMAVAGSLTAYGVYRLAAWRASIQSPRRAFAAALGGYAGINAAALCAAVEFGVQPGWFHDAAGTPLYAPYPLSIAVPAMMLGHLTFAGLAEAVISGGLVAYLQRADPSLLGEGRLKVQGSRSKEVSRPKAQGPKAGAGGGALRPLWVGLAALMVVTPLGLLAAGTAWGEWSVKDFQDPAARRQMAAVSAQAVPPEGAPGGLARLAGLWSAPLPDYAPPFLKDPKLGYALSALFGGGLIVLAWQGAGWLLRTVPSRPGARLPLAP